MTWVKICATTSLHDAQMSVAVGANALGFIFAPSSRRIEVEQAGEIIAALPIEIEKIGVFVNESPGRVEDIAERAGLTGAQLHGEEPPEQMAEFRGALGQRRRIIKMLQARELLATDGGRVLQAYLDARENIDAILLDSGSPAQRGGTGMPFPWEEAARLAAAVQADVPLIIAGGLTAGNVSQAIRLFNPWGVDVVSGVEEAIGKKDEGKLRSFVAAVRRANGQILPGS